MRRRCLTARRWWNAANSGKALAIATWASGIGGLISVAVLAASMTTIAPLILKFSTEEYFVLTVFGIVIIVTLSGDCLLRGMLAALLGLGLSTFGLDPVVPVPRVTFEIPEMLTGFPVVPAFIGLICVSQGLLMFESGMWSAASGELAEGGRGMNTRLSLRELFRIRWTILRSAFSASPWRSAACRSCHCRSHSCSARKWRSTSANR